MRQSWLVHLTTGLNTKLYVFGGVRHQYFQITCVEKDAFIQIIIKEIRHFELDNRKSTIKKDCLLLIR
jgi:hypothetical protein